MSYNAFNGRELMRKRWEIQIPVHRIDSTFSATGMAVQLWMLIIQTRSPRRLYSLTSKGLVGGDIERCNTNGYDFPFTHRTRLSPPYPSISNGA